MFDLYQSIKSLHKLCLITLCLCVSVVNTQRLDAQTLSFPATKADQQFVLQAALKTPLNLRSVCFAKDGLSLYVGAYREVLVWSLADAKLAARWTDDNLTGMVTAMQLCDDGKTLAVAAGSPSASTTAVVFIDTQSGKRTAIMQQLGDTVLCMALRTDGTQLAMGTYDGMLTLWDIKQRTIIKDFPQQADALTDITFDDKDTLLASCNRAGQVTVYETTEGFPGKFNTSMEDAATSLLFENGKTINLAVAVGGNKERSVRLINTKTVKGPRKFGNTPEIPMDICWATNNKIAYLAGSDGNIVSWKRLGQIEKTFKAHTDRVTGISLSPDEKRLASVSLDGSTRIWDATSGLLLATLLQLAPQSDDWLLITAQGTFNASAPDKVTFFNQPAQEQDNLRKQWQSAQQVRELLGIIAK